MVINLNTYCGDLGVIKHDKLLHFSPDSSFLNKLLFKI